MEVTENGCCIFCSEKLVIAGRSSENHIYKFLQKIFSCDNASLNTIKDSNFSNLEICVYCFDICNGIINSNIKISPKSLRTASYVCFVCDEKKSNLVKIVDNSSFADLLSKHYKQLGSKICTSCIFNASYSLKFKNILLQKFPSIGNFLKPITIESDSSEEFLNKKTIRSRENKNKTCSSNKKSTSEQLKNLKSLNQQKGPSIRTLYDDKTQLYSLIPYVRIKRIKLPKLKESSPKSTKEEVKAKLEKHAPNISQLKKPAFKIRLKELSKNKIHRAVKSIGNDKNFINDLKKYGINKVLQVNVLKISPKKSINILQNISISPPTRTKAERKCLDIENSLENLTDSAKKRKTVSFAENSNVEINEETLSTHFKHNIKKNPKKSILKSPETSKQIFSCDESEEEANRAYFMANIELLNKRKRNIDTSLSSSDEEETKLKKEKALKRKRILDSSEYKEKLSKSFKTKSNEGKHSDSNSEEAIEIDLSNNDRIELITLSEDKENSSDNEIVLKRKDETRVFRGANNIDASKEKDNLSNTEKENVECSDKDEDDKKTNEKVNKVVKKYRPKPKCMQNKKGDRESSESDEETLQTNSKKSKDNLKEAKNNRQPDVSLQNKENKERQTGENNSAVDNESSTNENEKLSDIDKFKENSDKDEDECMNDENEKAKESRSRVEKSEFTDSVKGENIKKEVIKKRGFEQRSNRKKTDNVNSSDSDEDFNKSKGEDKSKTKINKSKRIKARSRIIQPSPSNSDSSNDDNTKISDKDEENTNKLKKYKPGPKSKRKYRETDHSSDKDDKSVFINESNDEIDDKKSESNTNTEDKQNKNDETESTKKTPQSDSELTMKECDESSNQKQNKSLDDSLNSEPAQNSNQKRKILKLRRTQSDDESTDSEIKNGGKFIKKNEELSLDNDGTTNSNSETDNASNKNKNTRIVISTDSESDCQNNKTKNKVRNKKYKPKPKCKKTGMENDTDASPHLQVEDNSKKSGPQENDSDASLDLISKSVNINEANVIDILDSSIEEPLEWIVEDEVLSDDNSTSKSKEAENTDESQSDAQIPAEKNSQASEGTNGPNDNDSPKLTSNNESSQDRHLHEMDVSLQTSCEKKDSSSSLTDMSDKAVIFSSNEKNVESEADDGSNLSDKSYILDSNKKTKTNLPFKADELNCIIQKYTEKPSEISIFSSDEADKSSEINEIAEIDSARIDLNEENYVEGELSTNNERIDPLEENLILNDAENIQNIQTSLEEMLSQDLISDDIPFLEKETNSSCKENKDLSSVDTQNILEKNTTRLEHSCSNI